MSSKSGKNQHRAFQEVCRSDGRVSTTDAMRKHYKSIYVWVEEEGNGREKPKILQVWASQPLMTERIEDACNALHADGYEVIAITTLDGHCYENWDSARTHSVVITGRIMSR
ncbi:hypothetical protein N9109_00785 [bacterium]|nr:hypothetical protein [bacterium]